jgi:hypothetical protein
MSATVDELHDQIDGLVLSVFESMRAASGASPQVDQDSAVIMGKYAAACQTIENLVGINSTEADQLATLRDLSDRYAASKSRALSIQEKLLALKAEVDEQLEKELNTTR